MTTKLKFLWVLLALLVGGVNGVWAETYITDYSSLTVKGDLTALLNSGITSSDGLIAISFSNVGTDHQADGNSAPYTIKSRGSSSDNRNATITVSGANSSILISQVVLVYGTDRAYTSEGATITYDSGSGRKTFSYATPATSVSMVNSIGNTNISSIEVTYTDSRTELSSSDFMFNRTDELYSGGSNNLFVNNTKFNTEASDPFEFVYDATKTTLRAKLNLLSAMSATAADFSVTSSNASVLDVSGATFGMSGTDRVYIYGIQVLSAGTANLTFTYRGSNTYKPASRTVTFNVKSPNTTYAGSYAYT